MSTRSGSITQLSFTEGLSAPVASNCPRRPSGPRSEASASLLSTAWSAWVALLNRCGCRLGCSTSGQSVATWVGLALVEVKYGREVRLMPSGWEGSPPTVPLASTSSS